MADKSLYENGEAVPQMPDGTTLEDVWRMARGAREAARKCLDHLQSWDGHLGTIMRELAELRSRPSARPPPVRPELPSIMDPVEFARKVKEAAIVGLRTDGTTPEEQVDKQIKRYNDAQLLAQLLAEREARSKTVAKWTLAVASIILAAIIGHFIH